MPRRYQPVLVTALLVSCALLIAKAQPSGAQMQAPTPDTAGPLVANPKPLSFEAGPLGTVYVSGIVSALGLVQTNHVPDDHSRLIDISNGQLMLQTLEGPLRFYAQAGIYALPVVGRPYLSAATTSSALYGPLPVAYLTVSPSENFSIQAGKLPTLIGPEPTFSFQNMNIQRGLLWDLEPSVSRGIQANYAAGPMTFALSWNDGHYSNQYTWLSGSVSWALDRNTTVTLVAGGNLARSTVDTFATPATLNNGQIFHVTYTYKSAPWTLTSYVQVTHTPRDAALGWTHDAQTYGGALLVDYAFTERFNLAGRTEIVASTGSRANGAPSLLYGPGSGAFTLTVTPTYQAARFFVRSEASLTQARNITPGFAFGKNGTSTSQAQFLIETGVIF